MSSKSNAFFVLFIVLCFFFKKKSVVFIENALYFKCYSTATPTFACYLSFTWYEWKNQKKWQQPVPDRSDGSEDFFSELFFWIRVWRASKEQFSFFETKSNLKGSPLISKATSGYFDQSVCNWIKRNVFLLFLLKKTDLTGTIKASPNLPGGAGKFPPVTCGNRSNRYLRRFLPASAGNFLRASFTVYHWRTPLAQKRWIFSNSFFCYLAELDQFRLVHISILHSKSGTGENA